MAEYTGEHKEYIILSEIDLHMEEAHDYYNDYENELSFQIGFSRIVLEIIWAHLFSAFWKCFEIKFL